MVGRHYITIFGGLGNQLFQLSAAIILSKDRKVNLVSPFSWAKGNHKDEYHLFLENLSGLRFCSNPLVRLISSVTIFLPSRCLDLWALLSLNVKHEPFSSEYWRAGGPTGASFSFHTGYFQSDYLVDSSGLAKQLVRAFDLIEGSSSSVVVMHVRGGDYIPAKRLFGLLNQEYYRNCLANISGSDGVLVITNDLIYSAELMLGIEVEFSSNNSVLDDFRLALDSKIFIGGNSTFSWWIAKVRSQLGKDAYLPEPFFPASSSLRPESNLLISGVLLEKGTFRD
jgi:hypothetical protein